MTNEEEEVKKRKKGKKTVEIKPDKGLENKIFGGSKQRKG